MFETPVLSATCLSCRSKGAGVDLITLKALLRPAALAVLEPMEEYHFCASPDCDVVYFSAARTFSRAELKVPVFQKDRSDGVFVCSCFGYRRRDVEEAARMNSGAELTASIRDHIRAKRCGCTVNNPQGRCCLGNVLTVLEQFSPTDQLP
jgi:hypothetical protein